MAIFPLGAIVKNRREELNLTQEELADGICSVPTLSRIENGERIPTKGIYEMLMQRLGYSEMSLDFFTNRKEFTLYNLKFKMRQAYVFGDFDLAKGYLADFMNLCNMESPMDIQFMQLYDVLLYEDKYTLNERLAKLEQALNLTCTKYAQGKYPKVLTYEEIILLNNIAVCYAEGGNQNTAIAILTMLKDYYSSKVINMEEALRTQPMVLYNLSKYLGRNGNYDECIDACDLGIGIARKTGRCLSLHQTMYNKAWALLRRGGIGDGEIAQKTLESAIALADALGYQADCEFMKEFYHRTFSAAESE